MKTSTCKMQKTISPANEFKRSIKIVLCLLFTFSSTVVYSQSKDNNKIPLENVDEKIAKDCKPKRDLDILSVLPDVMHNTTNAELIIVSQHITFETVTYYIKDEFGFVLYSDELTLIKGIEETLPISALPAGTYDIILEIGDNSFIGKFDVE